MAKTLFAQPEPQRHLFAALEDRVRKALAGTPVTLFSQDADLRYVWIFNPHSDFDPDDVVGRTDEDLLEPDAAEAVVAVKRDVLATGEGRCATVEMVAKDGGDARVYDLHVEPVTDEAGKVTGVVCASVDVTERHAEAKAARRAEARFRDSVESLMDAFGVYSAVREADGRIADFRVDYVNEAACRANNMSREEQVGKLLCEILPGHRETGLFDAYCHVVETGEPLKRRDEIFADEWGSGQKLVRAFDISAGKHGDGFVAAWRDVTDKRQQELTLSAALEESDLLREELEHRVANNLQLLMGLLGVAARGADPVAAEALTRARQQVKLVASLYSRLHVSGGEAGRVSLDQYLEEICEAMRTGLDLAQRRITLEVTTVAASLGTNAAIHLGLVVNELVTNAVKYAFPGRDHGSIAVALRREGDNLELTVVDDGVGMPAAGSSGGGTGSSLTKRLADSFGGRLERQTSPAGTTFRLAFREASPR